ncbi:MAG TPA: hypothetical protein PLJ18_12180, partial [Niabella sp.]|nr:hypothetical protein [Niabella sp.]
KMKENKEHYTIAKEDIYSAVPLKKTGNKKQYAEKGDILVVHKKDYSMYLCSKQHGKDKFWVNVNRLKIS